MPRTQRKAKIPTCSDRLCGAPAAEGSVERGNGLGFCEQHEGGVFAPLRAWLDGTDACDPGKSFNIARYTWRAWREDELHGRGEHRGPRIF